MGERGAGGGRAVDVGQRKLWLVRSSEILTSESAYNRLANYYWNYETRSRRSRPRRRTAIGRRAGRTAAGAAAHGRIVEFASTPRRVTRPVIPLGRARLGRAGAAACRRQYDNDRYEKLIGGLLRYLLSLRRSED